MAAGLKSLSKTQKLQPPLFRTFSQANEPEKPPKKKGKEKQKEKQQNKQSNRQKINKNNINTPEIFHSPDVTPTDHKPQGNIDEDNDDITEDADKV